MGWFSNAVTWVCKTVVTLVVSSVTVAVKTVGDFIDGALEAGDSFIECLTNTSFKSCGTFGGQGGNDPLIGLSSDSSANLSPAMPATKRLHRRSKAKAAASPS